GVCGEGWKESVEPLCAERQNRSAVSLAYRAAVRDATHSALRASVAAASGSRTRESCDTASSTRCPIPRRLCPDATCFGAGQLRCGGAPTPRVSIVRRRATLATQAWRRG